MRQRVSSTRVSDVPSAAFRARATNPAIQKILDAYPAGTIRTSDADIDRYEQDRSNAWREDSGTLRLDHRFNDNNSMYARYNTDNGVVDQPLSALEGDRETAYLPTHFVLQCQRVFTPTVMNEWKAGVNRAPLNRYSYGPFGETIGISGFQGLNDSNKAVETGTSYSLVDNLAITRGRHTLKIGGEIRRVHVNVGDPLYGSFTVSYPSRTAFLNNAVDSVAIGTGNAVLGTRKWDYYG
jgi:hypothetical protein